MNTRGDKQEVSENSEASGQSRSTKGHPQRQKFLLTTCLEAYARSLEGSPLQGSEALIESIQKTVELLFAKADELAKASRPTEPLPQVAFHERETVAVEAVREVRWGKAEKLLHEDILNLYRLEDQPGVMTSVERLVMLAPDAVELKTFLESNEETLRRLYEGSFGSLKRIPVPLRDRTPVKIPTPKAALVVKTLQLIDGIKTIEDVIRESEFGELMTLIILSHLSRSGFIEIA